MKKTMGNDKGYAMLVVLFLIVFIFTVSAVFMRGSLSNAKQEQRVDQNHLSVVAAEMGVDYYVGKINNEERKIQREVLDTIHGDIVTFNNCNGILNSNKPGCQSVKSIETILNKAKDDYLKRIDTLVEEVEKSGNTNIELYSSETTNIKSSPYSYQVNKDEVSLQERDGSVTIKLGIVGYSKAERPKLLKTEITYEIPKFVIRKSTSGNQREPDHNPTDIYDFFKKNSDYEKKVGCSAQNGHCSSGNFYSEGKQSANNPNNQGGLIWIHNGYLNVNNMNKFNFTLIVSSLSGKNMNNMKGKLVLLGEANQKGEIPKDISVGFENSGRICINVDGFPERDIKKISFNKPNQVYFYSSSDSPSWPSNANNSPKRTGSLTNFINECVGQPLLEIETPGVDQYEVFESALNLLVDVKY